MSSRAPMIFSKSTLALAACLAATAATGFAFRAFDWGQGTTRGLILFEMLVALALVGAPKRPAEVGPWLKLAVNAALAGAAALWLAGAAQAIATTARTGKIPLDQGQTTFRAARLLLNGENPYGYGALVDFQAFSDRLPAREAAALGPAVPRDAVAAAEAAYDLTLAPAERAKLLAPAAPGALEARLLGYKYGPLFLVMTLPLAKLGWPAGVMALNAAAAVVTLALLYRLMRARADASLARMGVAALICDNTMLINYVEHSATDIWALLFCSLAVLAFLRGRLSWAAAALAIGFGFKILPCALLLPMLLRERRAQPLLVFAGVAAAIYLPFAAADPLGLLHNVLLWPIHLTPDSTSWLYFQPPIVGAIARAAGLALIAAAWARWLSGRELSLFRTLALVSLLALLGGGAVHNNYLPWATIWIVAALAERFGPVFAGETAAAELAAEAARA